MGFRVAGHRFPSSKGAVCAAIKRQWRGGHVGNHLVLNAWNQFLKKKKKKKSADTRGRGCCPVAENEKRPNFTSSETRSRVTEMHTRIPVSEKLLSNLGNNHTVAQACSLEVFLYRLPLNWQKSSELVCVCVRVCVSIHRNKMTAAKLSV